MKRLAAMLGALVLAGGAAGADDPGKAPLEGSKQELRALQADQTAQNSGAQGSKLTDGLPRLDSPLPGAAATDSVTPVKMEKEAKKHKDAQKNWLLDGVNRLEKSGQAGAHRKDSRRDDINQEGDETTDDDKDETLLTLYEREGRTADAKAENSHPVPVRNDPLAPFLQGWLADSPVRGKFFDDFTGRPDRNGVAAAPGFQPGGPTQPVRDGEALETAPFTSSSPPHSNPYLQAEAVGFSRDSGTAAGPGQLSAQPAGSVTLGPPPADTSKDPAPATRPTAGIPPLLAPTDAQKYFPQQKKF